MAFYARSFIFDDTPSDLYGLIISSNDSGESSSPTSNIELKTQEIFRRPTRFFYGVQQTPPIELSVSFRTTENELTAEDSALAQKWLFNQPTYKILRIQQPDLEDYYFKGVFVDGNVVRVGNIVVGFDAKFICDSPFAYGNTKTINFTQSNKTYRIYNESENLFYTYPKLEIHMNGTGSDFIIKNVTDNNRTMSINNLVAGEVVTIDNDLQIITSSTGDNTLNKIESPIQFFRLLNGLNEVYLFGHIVKVTLTYTPLKRIA